MRSVAKMRSMPGRQVIGVAFATLVATVGGAIAVAAASSVSTAPPPAFVSPTQQGASDTAPEPTPEQRELVVTTSVSATSSPVGVDDSDDRSPTPNSDDNFGPSTPVDDDRSPAVTATTVDDHGRDRQRDDETSDDSDNSGSGSNTSGSGSDISRGSGSGKSGSDDTHSESD